MIRTDILDLLALNYVSLVIDHSALVIREGRMTNDERSLVGAGCNGPPSH